MRNRHVFAGIGLFALALSGCTEKPRSHVEANPTGSDAIHRTTTDPLGKATQITTNELNIVQPGQTNNPDIELAQKVRVFLTTRSTGTQGVMNERDLIPIQVIAKNGEITLAGAVESDKQRQQIEESVRGFRGVRSVINRLEVNPSRASIPTSIKQVQNLDKKQ